MEKIISGVYGFLADILRFIAGIPGDISTGEYGLLFLMVVIFNIAAIVLLFFAIHANGEDYHFYVKLTVGAILIAILVHCAALKDAGLDILQTVPFYGSIIAGMFLVGTAVFLVVNFLLDFQMGKVTLLIWVSEFLFACGVMRLWEYIKGSGGTPQYEKVMVLSGFRNWLVTTFQKLGISALIGIVEYILLISMMFVIVYYLFKTRKFLEDEWIGCVGSQVLSGIAYLIYQAHDGISWRTDETFMVFLLFCLGEMLYLFIFCYEVKNKKHDGCIGAFFVGLSGVLWHCVIVLAVDMTKRGAMGKSLTKISALMTQIYRIVPIGLHINFGQGKVFTALIGMLIAVVVAIAILFILFWVLGRVLPYDETGAEMGEGWFRNCSMVMILPVIICWVCSMYGDLFGNSYQWVSLAIQSVSNIGSALCISNIAPAFNHGFLSQLKLVLISTIVSFVVVCLLVPVILALI